MSLCATSTALILFLFYSIPFSVSTSSNEDFISDSCKRTRYPSLCYRSLYSFSHNIKQDPMLLTQTALLVSLLRAQRAAAVTKKLSTQKGMKYLEAMAMADCTENADDGVTLLRDSIKELKKINQTYLQNPQWHLTNAQTWVSGALTDYDTCIDGFDDLGLDDELKKKVGQIMSRVAKVTSIALSFLNQLACECPNSKLDSIRC